MYILKDPIRWEIKENELLLPKRMNCRAWDKWLYSRQKMSFRSQLNSHPWL